MSDHDVPGSAPTVPPPLVAVPDAPRPSPAVEARTLVAQTHIATLATLSEDGTPWASLVAYAQLPDGAPVLCLSGLAEHERNLRADPRASLLVCGPIGADPLAAARVTLAGRAQLAADEVGAAAREALIAQVPSAAVYVDFGDFSLRTLVVERVRWVGGYGRMASAEGADYAAAAADPVAPAAAGAVEHLNADHADALLEMARALAGHPDATAASCTGADQLGLDLLVETPRGRAPARIAFAAPLLERDGLRAATVELARRARAGAGASA